MYLELCSQFSRLQEINTFQKVLINFPQLFCTHCWWKKEKESLSSTILRKQQSKYQRDNITVFDHPQKTRRFRKSKRRHHNNQRKLLYREKQRKVTEVPKITCPDQNAINLSNKELSHAEQSLLRKSPSFMPTPADIKENKSKQYRSIYWTCWKRSA